MKTISILKNKIQEYEWGSYTAISELLGKSSPSDTPQAELWMGANPKASSMIEVNGEWLSLNELLGKYPEDILGETAAKNLITDFRISSKFLPRQNRFQYRLIRIVYRQRKDLKERINWVSH